MTPYGKLFLTGSCFTNHNQGFYAMASPPPYPPQVQTAQPSGSEEAHDHWNNFLTTFFSADVLPQSALQTIFEPIRATSLDSMTVIGQIGQTMDGRIATITGQSKYINGSSGLSHLHQLRALVDAVVIGVGTALTDNPQLNVRLVSGKNPTRVVIDPQGRLGCDAQVWREDGTKRLWIIAEGKKVSAPSGVEVLTLPMVDGRIEAATILKSLRMQGLKRILIEGGAFTLSHFMQAGCLDRLHIIIAPIIMGSGRPSFELPAIEHMDQATRLNIQTHVLNNEVLFDCDLSSQRLKLD